MYPFLALFIYYLIRRTDKDRRAIAENMWVYIRLNVVRNWTDEISGAVNACVIFSLDLFNQGN